MGGPQAQGMEGPQGIEAHHQAALHVKGAGTRRPAGLDAKGPLLRFVGRPDGVHVAQEQHLPVALSPRGVHVIAKGCLRQPLHPGADGGQGLAHIVGHPVDRLTLVAGRVQRHEAGQDLDHGFLL